MERMKSILAAGTILLIIGAAPSRAADAPHQPRPEVGLLNEAAEKQMAARIVGPEATNNNCATCHVIEDQAWQTTHHFTTFLQRHRSDRAQEILKNMGMRTMKRQGECRQCHYTSVINNDQIVPTWGVSCESCHGPAQDWVNVHNKVGGDPKGTVLKWGTARTETKAQHEARISAAEAKGMISSRMIYDIATNCFECHTVPDETLVNKGKHHAGSDFDLVSWSQGEVRHNFADSAGAPEHPTNRTITPEQRRRLYVVGALVDLQFSLRNLAGAKQAGGDFQKAMAQRVNRARAKLAAVLAVVKIPEIAAVVDQVPQNVQDSTAIPADLPAKFTDAGRAFAAKYDGTALAPIDPQIPIKVMGTPYKE